MIRIARVSQATRFLSNICYVRQFSDMGHMARVLNETVAQSWPTNSSQITPMQRLVNVKPAISSEEEENENYDDLMEGLPELYDYDDVDKKTGEVDPTVKLGKHILHLGKVHYRAEESLSERFREKKAKICSYRTAPQIRRCLKDWMLRSDREIQFLYRTRKIGWLKGGAAADSSINATYAATLNGNKKQGEGEEMDEQEEIEGEEESRQGSKQKKGKAKGNRRGGAEEERSGFGGTLKSKEQLIAEEAGRRIVYGPEETVAYAHYYMPNRYGLLKRVFREINTLLPAHTYAPRRVVDFGCGPGTAAAALIDVCNTGSYAYSKPANGGSAGSGGGDTRKSPCWRVGEDFKKYVGIDVSSSMIDAAKIMLSPRTAEEQAPPVESEQQEGGAGGEGEGSAEEKEAAAMRSWYGGRRGSGGMRGRGSAVVDEAPVDAVFWDKTSEVVRRVAQYHREHDHSVNTNDRNDSRYARRNNGQSPRGTPASPSTQAEVGEDRYGNQRYDMAVAAFTLSELSSDRNKMAAVQLLYEMLDVDGLLVIVEGGSPKGSHIVRSARKLILDSFGAGRSHYEPTEGSAAAGARGRKGDKPGANGKVGEEEEEAALLTPVLPPPPGYSLHEELVASVIAPCTHDQACPLGDGVWCSFSQKVFGGMIRKGHEEKFSYVVIQKQARNRGGASSNSKQALQEQQLQPTPVQILQRFINAGSNEKKRRALMEKLLDEVDWVGDGEGGGGYRPVWRREEYGRILRSPIKRQGHVIMDLCTPAGHVKRHVVSKGQLLDIPSLYTAVRKTTWGGLHPIVMAPASGAAFGAADKSSRHGKQRNSYGSGYEEEEEQLQEYSPLLKVPRNSHGHNNGSDRGLYTPHDDDLLRRLESDDEAFERTLAAGGMEEGEGDERPATTKLSEERRERLGKNRDRNELTKPSPFARSSLPKQNRPDSRSTSKGEGRQQATMAAKGAAARRIDDDDHGEDQDDADEGEYGHSGEADDGEDRKLRRVFRQMGSASGADGSLSMDEAQLQELKRLMSTGGVGGGGATGGLIDRVQVRRSGEGGGGSTEEEDDDAVAQMLWQQMGGAAGGGSRSSGGVRSRHRPMRGRRVLDVGGSANGESDATSVPGERRRPTGMRRRPM